MISQILPSEPREGLIRALVLAEGETDATPRGVTLSRLAELVQLSAPVVLRHLDILLRAGIVEKVPVPRSRASLYRARPFFQAVWVDPHRGLVTNWESASEFDWTLPLVSRVPDERARRTLLKLLPMARSKGLLTPHDERGKSNPNGHLPAIVVHGSCARGDARPESDLDLIVRTGRGSSMARKAWKSFVAEANLWAERPIDVRILSLKEFLKAPAEFQRGLTREALTIWAPYPSDEFLEGLHVQSLLETGRRANARKAEGPS